MDISKFNPFASRKRKHIVAEPLTVNPRLFFMEWTRGPIPKTQGAESYWLSSNQLPMYDLSGPLPTNARRINIALPAPAQAERRFADATIGGAGILQGQVYSQPLYNEKTGGYTQSQYPVVPLPFSNSIGFDAISPAGVA